MLKSASFRGGAHPREEKHLTEHKAIQNLPLPEQVIIPLQQHIGTPAEPVVQKGDIVKTGQIIGEAKKFVSVPCHASVSGTVLAVEPRPHPLGTNLLSIVIESDGTDTPIDSFDPDPKYMDRSVKEMKKRILTGGIAGMGGAAFPTHVKLSPPPEKPIEIVFLNGVECEPYLTSDHRLMLEHPDDILNGLFILMKILDVKKAIIGIEKNKPDAIRLMQNRLSGKKNISVLPLTVKYPQGAEKQLINAATGRQVPSGGLPMDVGCLVQNVGTSMAVYQAVSSQRPLIDRVITVTGNCVQTPNNVRARIGTPFMDLIEFCGGYSDSASKLINGGPMMGIAQVTDTVPVIKGSSGILVLDEKMGRLKEERPCIACARCVDVCPMKLLPSTIACNVEYNRTEEAHKLGLLDCIECGTCGFICPAKRNLVHYIKLGKARWNEMERDSE